MPVNEQRVNRRVSHCASPDDVGFLLLKEALEKVTEYLTLYLLFFLRLMESCPHGWSHTGRLPSRGPESLSSQAENLAGKCFFSSEIVVGRTRISTFQKDRFCFMCMTECHHVCICTTCVLTVTGGQTRALDLLELELDSGEPSCGCWEQTLGYPPEQQVTLTTESSPQP